ncbi:hypothetical protein K458DRAFT_323446 [Lentithecium fluviatile CBS 122367]|uniref:Uncharacterized protein n=1 Tax=Lentithecium fluviatile CBS 122367 TaxID=1168545 RepID=A0A6G1IDD4_9PLEO|nr:hypothetical protein K458DRAFT_323446 [Lentithecium fluviatile CBS 122367]
MRGLEQELVDTLEAHRGTDGEPLAGLFTTTRQLENEEEDQFDVDLTIQDFLTYKATESLFEWRASSNPYQSDLPDALLTMTAEWRTFLKHRHNGRRLNTQAAFRSRLLQFALLFSHRLNHDKTWTSEESLNELRAQNRKRGYYWQHYTAHAPALRQPFDTPSEFPLSDGALAENRHELASSLGQPQDRRRWVTDVEGTPSLHCLLPLFVELTEARVMLGGWSPAEGWMDLVGQFMLQAVIEEYLQNGAYGEEAFNTIFAFGCPGSARRPDEGTDIQAMRTLFCVEGNTREQIDGWSRVKRRYISELLPGQGSPTSFLQAMERAQERFPYVEFEKKILSFLKYLHNELVKPDLVQVEQGQININGTELPETETRDVMRRIGL